MDRHIGSIVQYGELNLTREDSKATKRSECLGLVAIASGRDINQFDDNVGGYLSD